MRSSSHAFKCSACYSSIQVALTFPTWVQKAATYVEKIAAAEEWDLERRLCPICKVGKP